MRSYIVALLCLAGCSTLQGPAGAIPVAGLERVYRVSEGIYRSPQPNASQFKALVASLGIKTVLKLNSALEGHDELPAGVDLVHDPMSAVLTPSSKQIAEVCADVATAQRPLLIHCTHGEDRTGLIVALCVRVRLEHSLAPFAFSEAEAYGFHDGEVNKPGLPGLVEAYERETGFSP